MRKVLLILILIIQSFHSNGQTIRETLEGVKCVEFQNGILLHGFEGEVGQHSFSIIHYDKELNVIHKYKKEIPGEVTILWSYCIVYGDHIDVYVKSKPRNCFIRLDNNLKEESFELITDAVKQEDKAKIKASNAIALSYIPVLERSSGRYDRGFNHKAFLKSDMLHFDLKKESIGRYKSAPGLKLDRCYYSTAWETPIEGFDKVKSTGIVYADENDIVNCLITRGKNKFWDDCIVRLDAKTGVIKNKINTVYPDKNEVFFLSNVYFDSETENIIAIGQLYEDKLKLEMHATAIMIYNKSGELVSSKKIEFPVHEIDAPRFIDLKDQAQVVKNIGKISKGKYFVIIENDCQKTVSSNNGKTSTSSSFFYPIAYSYFEMDENCNVTNNRIQYLTEFKAGIMSAKSTGNEKFIMLSQDFGGTKKVSVINFASKNDNMMEEIDSFDFVGTGNYDFNANYDSDFFSQFIIDDKHGITFQKFRKSNIYQLKSISVK